MSEQKTIDGLRYKRHFWGGRSAVSLSNGDVVEEVPAVGAVIECPRCCTWWSGDARDQLAADHVCVPQNWSLPLFVERTPAAIRFAELGVSRPNPKASLHEQYDALAMMFAALAELEMKR